MQFGEGNDYLFEIGLYFSEVLLTFITLEMHEILCIAGRVIQIGMERVIFCLFQLCWYVHKRALKHQCGSHNSVVGNI